MRVLQLKRVIESRGLRPVIPRQAKRAEGSRERLARTAAMKTHYTSLAGSFVVCATQDDRRGEVALRSGGLRIPAYAFAFPS